MVDILRDHHGAFGHPPPDVLGIAMFVRRHPPHGVGDGPVFRLFKLGHVSSSGWFNVIKVSGVRCRVSGVRKNP
jgi:hypothetical protein